MKPRKDIYTGIEIGTSTIKVVVGQFEEDDTLTVLAANETPSLKMLKAEPVNPDFVFEQLVMALKSVMADMGWERLPGYILFSLSGSYIRPQIRAVTAQLSEHDPITEEIAEDLLHRTHELDTANPQDDSPILMKVPRCFHLADGRTLFNPISQYSSSLTLDMLYFLVDTPRFNSIAGVISDALNGRIVDANIYAPLAVAAAVFPTTISDETLGLVIDIGAGMTSICIPSTLGYFVSEQLAVGCDHIANDLSIGLDINMPTAQQLLKDMPHILCTAVATHDGDARLVSIRQDGNPKEPPRSLPADAIETIVEARLREIFEWVKQRLEQNGAFEWLGNEIFLSGGGALIPRIAELAGAVLKRKVSPAVPFKIAGKTEIVYDGKPDSVTSPRFLNVLGLLRAGRRDILIQKAVRERTGNTTLADRARQFFNLFLNG